MEERLYAAYIGDYKTYYGGYIDGDLSSLEIRCIKKGCDLNVKFAVETLRAFCNMRPDICSYAVSKFILCDYINDYLINKFKPFYLWYPSFASKETYEYLLENFGFLKYNVGKAAIIMHYNDIYFSTNFEPESELFRSACFTSNKEVYEDQLRKAKKLGYFYKYLDIDSESSLEVAEIDDFEGCEFGFDPSRVFGDSNSFGEQYEAEYLESEEFKECVEEIKKFDRFVSDFKNNC